MYDLRQHLSRSDGQSLHCTSKRTFVSCITELNYVTFAHIEIHLPYITAHVDSLFKSSCNI